MPALSTHIRLRPRLAIGAAAGIVVAAVLPGMPLWPTRVLVGWNVAVWLYLGLVAGVMLRADHHQLRRVAVAQAEGAGVVLFVVSAAAVASLGAIVAELAVAKGAPGGAALSHLLFAGATVSGAWLLVPVMFSLDYASRYYRQTPPGGLAFPSSDDHFNPDYTDFLYFSMTIAVASQTSDVSVNARPMRQVVLVQSVLAFFFNAAILALTINIAASMIR